MLWLFNKDEKIWFWGEGNHTEQIETRAFFQTKPNYIHLNPVRAGIVEKEEDMYIVAAAIITKQK